MQVKVGDLVKTLINEYTVEDDEINIPAGTHGLVVGEVDLEYKYANKIWLVKLLSREFKDHHNVYYASDLEVINAGG